MAFLRTETLIVCAVTLVYFLHSATAEVDLCDNAMNDPDADPAVVQLCELSQAEPIEEGPGKRKNEFIRFGKRKNEFIRFGKRKNEFIRFGRSAHDMNAWNGPDKRKNEFIRFGRNGLSDVPVDAMNQFVRFGKRSYEPGLPTAINEFVRFGRSLLSSGVIFVHLCLIRSLLLTWFLIIYTNILC